MPKMGYQEFLLPKWNARHGHEVHIFTSDRYYPIPHYEETWGQFLGPRICGAGVEQIDGVIVHRLKCLWEWKARPWLLGLERKLSELSPDVLFCHGSASLTAFRIAIFAKRTGIPVLMDNHMTYVAQNRSPLGRLYYMSLKVLSRGVLSNSVFRFLGVAQECCDFLQGEQGIPHYQIECLPLGVDTDLFRPDELAGRRVRCEHWIPLDAKVVLQTGKLSPEKGAHWLAQAMVKIMKYQSDVWLVFVGAGKEDYVEEIRLPFVEQGIADRLRILPFVPASHLAGIYCAAEICVYPGASSLSCLEAAACGRAVILTDLPASKWRAELGVGICYRTGDVDDLRRKIEDLLGDPERRRALGERARASVVKHFSYDVIAHRAEELMYKAIAEHSQ